MYEFLLNSTFYGWYDCFGRSFPILHCLLVSGWVMLGVSENCNDQYNKLCWLYCYLLVYYLLLAVLVFYSVFIAIYMTSFAGRYLSFSFNPLSVWQLPCFFAMFTIFLTSRSGRANHLAACGQVFIIVSYSSL